MRTRNINIYPNKGGRTYMEFTVGDYPEHNRGNWKIRVWDEGYLALCWQNLKDDWEDCKFCPWESIDIVDLGYSLLYNIRNYNGDKAGEEKIEDCLDCTIVKCTDFATENIKGQGFSFELQEKLKASIAFAIVAWTKRVKSKCATEYLEGLSAFPYDVEHKSYAVRYREYGNIYKEADTLEEAKEIIAYLEDLDLLGNTEEPDKYEIVNTQTGAIEK